jgi:hypothetical protein
MVADPVAEAALMTRQIDFFRAHLGLPVAGDGTVAGRIIDVTF